MTDELKEPNVKVGIKEVGKYLHAILREFQISHFVYLYSFDSSLRIVAELKDLLEPVGVIEITRRYTVKIPNKNNPKQMLNRHEIKFEKIAALKSLKWS